MPPPPSSFSTRYAVPSASCNRTDNSAMAAKDNVRVDVLRGPVYFDAVPFVLVAVLLLVTGCSGPFPQSVFAPKSDFASELDGLFWNIFWWAVAVFLIVETLLVIAIARYRARPGAQAPKPVHGHTLLEIGWTLAPALILVFIAVPTMRTVFST